MTNPITSTNHSIAGQNVAKAMGKTTWGLLAAGALAFTGWRMQDSFQGSRQKAQQEIAGLKTGNDYQLLEHSFGQWSGNPGMDNLADRFKGLTLYGPLRIKEHYESAKIHVKTFCGNVIGPNLVPLGVGLAGLYAAIGHKRMKEYGSGFSKWLTQSSPFKDAVWNTMKGVGGGLAKGVGFIIKEPTKLAFKSPQHFAVASGITLVGAFFGKRFVDTYNGDAQRDYYRNDVYMHQTKE